MRFSLVFSIALTLSHFTFAQVLSRRPETQIQPPESSAPVDSNLSIPLSVPVGTPLKIAIGKDIRVRHVGEAIQGKLVEPVYAFDRLVIPAGTQANGRISAISGVSTKTRMLAGMNADLSPRRTVQITFDELRLADGRTIPIHTQVAPGSNGVLQLVTPPEAKPGKKEEARNALTHRIAAARQEGRKEWDSIKAQIHDPGKMHRAERLALANMPYRPQYLDAGTIFNADLQQPLSFGEESRTAKSLSEIGTTPASGSVVHAELVTALSSAKNKKGDPVEAVVTQPVFQSDRLLIPEGSQLQGVVVQAHPARRLARSGILRIEFKTLVPPNGIAHQIAASLDAVEVARQEHLALDSEGGAHVQTPKTRYLTTALSVAVAASSASPEHDSNRVGDGADSGNGAVTGASGYRLLGTLVSVLARSRALSSGLGFYGAGMSVYSHFFTRGHEVVYPKDMSMLIGLDPRHPASH